MVVKNVGVQVVTDLVVDGEMDGEVDGEVDVEVDVVVDVQLIVPMLGSMLSVLSVEVVEVIGLYGGRDAVFTDAFCAEVNLNSLAELKVVLLQTILFGDYLRT